MYIGRVKTTYLKPMIRFASIVWAELLAFSAFALFRSLSSQLRTFLLATIFNPSILLINWLVLPPIFYTLGLYYATIIQSPTAHLAAAFLYYIPYTAFYLVFLAFLLQVSMLAVESLSSAALITYDYLIIHLIKVAFFWAANPDDLAFRRHLLLPRALPTTNPPLSTARTSAYNTTTILTIRALPLALTQRDTNAITADFNTDIFSKAQTIPRSPTLSPAQIIRRVYLQSATHRSATRIPFRLELPSQYFTATIAAMEDTLDKNGGDTTSIANSNSNGNGSSESGRGVASARKAIRSENADD